ncbi:MAG: hypothetical protein ACI81L_003451 [Verrucomicrobiales bacterium]|jgi:hypothetical protein
MTFSFQPHLIKQDSAVPLRMMAGGLIVGVAAVVSVGPVTNRATALIGLTLVAGGLIVLTLTGPRTWRMVFGAAAGAVASWLGYRFAFPDRIVPARDDPFELLHREHIAAIGLGLSVLSIGLGGLLESVRAQAAPGTSHIAVRALLVMIGMAIVGTLCVEFGVSRGVSAVATVAVGLGLTAMAWLRRERPTSDFVPRP